MQHRGNGTADGDDADASGWGDLMQLPEEPLREFGSQRNGRDDDPAYDHERKILL